MKVQTVPQAVKQGYLWADAMELAASQVFCMTTGHRDQRLLDLAVQEP